jgi:hypothetical protein
MRFSFLLLFELFEFDEDVISTLSSFGVGGFEIERVELSPKN